MRRWLAAAAAAVLLAGCGEATGTQGGGVIAGETLTVQTLLPLNGPRATAARDLVDGQKLALLEAGGTSGRFKLNFVASDIGRGRQVAERVRKALRDTQMVAAIADLDSETARTTVPLLNAGGILHVSPGATYPGFVAAVPGGPEQEPGFWRPSGRANFAPVPPTDAAQAVAVAQAARAPVHVENEAGEANDFLARAVRDRLGTRLTDETSEARTVVYVGDDPENAAGVLPALADEAPRARILLPEALLHTDVAERLPAPVRRRVRFLTVTQPPGDIARPFEARFGRCPSVHAVRGYEAMRGVLNALEAAGRRANRRPAVIREYLAGDPLLDAASRPWFLTTGPGCDDRYEPVG